MDPSAVCWGPHALLRGWQPQHLHHPGTHYYRCLRQRSAALPLSAASPVLYSSGGNRALQSSEQQRPRGPVIEMQVHTFGPHSARQSWTPCAPTAEAATTSQSLTLTLAHLAEDLDENQPAANHQSWCWPHLVKCFDEHALACPALACYDIQAGQEGDLLRLDERKVPGSRGARTVSRLLSACPSVMYAPH